MAPQLGEFFPEEFRRQQADLNFKIRAVYKTYSEAAQKEKRMIYVADKFDKTSIAVILINTEINPNLFPSPELKALHKELELVGREEYLEYTSFADCSQFFEYNKNEFYQELIDDPSIHIGWVSEEDFKSMREIIKGAKTISLSRKKEFGLFL